MSLSTEGRVLIHVQVFFTLIDICELKESSFFKIHQKTDFVGYLNKQEWKLIFEEPAGMSNKEELQNY